MANIENQICEAIELIADRKVNNAKYDQTIEAIVIQCENADTGKYLCKYQDSIITAYAPFPLAKYDKGDAVYILVPMNDMVNYKIIIGFSNSSDYKRKYNKVEGDEVDKIIRDLENEICKAIDTISSENIEVAKYDKTVEVEIIQCADEVAGKYLCRYENEIVEAYVPYAGVKYLGGDRVYMLIPINDVNNYKIIVGFSESFNHRNQISVKSVENLVAALGGTMTWNDADGAYSFLFGEKGV